MAVSGSGVQAMGAPLKAAGSSINLSHVPVPPSAASHSIIWVFCPFPINSVASSCSSN